MRIFWTIFFLGSMFVVGVDVMERRSGARVTAPAPAVADAMGIPTPRPKN